jgi:hypothetical protein
LDSGWFLGLVLIFAFPAPDKGGEGFLDKNLDDSCPSLDQSANRPGGHGPSGFQRNRRSASGRKTIGLGPKMIGLGPDTLQKRSG